MAKKEATHKRASYTYEGVAVGYSATECCKVSDNCTNQWKNVTCEKCLKLLKHELIGNG